MLKLPQSAFQPMIQQSNLVKDITQPLFDKVGLTHFNYIELNTKGEFIALCNNARKYTALLESNVAETMPLDIIQRNHFGIYISDLTNKDFYNPRFKKVFNYFNESHFLQILNKATRGDETILQFFMFATHHLNKEINHFYVNHLDMFKEFNQYFLHRLEPFLKKASPIGIPEKLSQVYQTKQNTITDPFKESIQFDSSKAFNHFLKKLSKRESEIIHWYMKGFTCNELGEKLYISSRTVERHLDNIKVKLHCRSRRQIFGRILELGYDIKNIMA